MRLRTSVTLPSDHRYRPTLYTYEVRIAGGPVLVIESESEQMAAVAYLVYLGVSSVVKRREVRVTEVEDGYRPGKLEADPI